MTRYRVLHRTSYAYSQAATHCHNEAHLRPRTCPQQTCLRHSLVVVPTPGTMDEREDSFGNIVQYFAIEEPHDRLDVVATSEVEASPPVCPQAATRERWETSAARTRVLRETELVEVRTFLSPSPFVPWGNALGEYARPSFPAGRSLLDAICDLTARIHADFIFDPASTTIATPLAEVLESRRGVCQDFAHLAIGCLRSMGIAARYVSGYLETIAPEGQERLVGADASHAWLSAYVPDFGWLDVDPTNNLVPASSHIVLAWGRDYGDVTPLKGVVTGGGAHSLAVAVDVERI